MHSTAPNFTSSEAIRPTCASLADVAFGLMYSRYTLRANRFAAAMDMTDAGTRAPTPIAANPRPANQFGRNVCSSTGTTVLASALRSTTIGLTCQAIATKPSSATRPSIIV